MTSIVLAVQMAVNVAMDIWLALEVVATSLICDHLNPVRHPTSVFVRTYMV